MIDGINSSGEQRLDVAVVASLYRSHARDLQTYLVGLLGDADLAADVVQATFVKVAEAGHTAAEESLRSWLFRVAHNEAMDRRRRTKVDRRAIRRAAWRKPEFDVPADEAARRSETVDCVRKAIEELPAEQRRVVLLRINEERTFAEIAAVTQAPLGTVLTRMRLAMKALARVLRDESSP